MYGLLYRLTSLIRSYLQFIPSRYGTSDCLTAATNCVLGKVKMILAPHLFSCQETMLGLYAKALKTLQHAISDESACLDSDVLCATQLLSLHEVKLLLPSSTSHFYTALPLTPPQLLDPTRDSAWVHHISGSARLVKNRTSARFETEFDKALFAAHVGPVLTQALVTNNHCYLEEPEWAALYESLILDTKYLHDRSTLTISIRILMFPLPGLWHDMGVVVNSEQLFDDEAMRALEERSRELQQKCLAWMEDYKSHCVRMSLLSPPPQELALRRELFGTSLECLMLLKRLIATVCDADREQLEVEGQALAHLLLELQEQPSPGFSWLFSGHEVGIAYATIHTKEEWAGSFFYGTEEERRLAQRNRFNAWSAFLRQFDHME